MSPADIKSDLDQGSTIVRAKQSAPEPPANATDDEVIKMLVQGKLQADSNTANATFEVNAKGGEVTLKGTADSAVTIGRAIALSLDTNGVTKVSADAKIGSAAKP